MSWLAVIDDPEALHVRFVCGTHYGPIHVYSQRRKFTMQSSLTVLNSHVGFVSALAYAPALGLVFSGSGDRTVKAWDLGAENTLNMLVQTMYGHGGSVTAMAVVGARTLVTAATDGCILVWHPSPGRERFKYPRMVVQQKIHDWGAGAWPTTLALKTSTVLRKHTFYAGDSEGNVHLFAPMSHADVINRGDDDTSSVVSSRDDGAVPAEEERRDGVRLRRGQDPTSSMDRLAALAGAVGNDDAPEVHVYAREAVLARHHAQGITSMVYAPGDNFLVTHGYDGVVVVTNTLSGSRVGTYAHPFGRLFSGMDYHADLKEVILCDDVGCVHIWNLYSEKLPLQRDVGIGPLTTASFWRTRGPGAYPDGEFVVTGPELARVIRMDRRVEWVEFLGHADAVCNVIHVPSETAGAAAERQRSTERLGASVSTVIATPDGSRARLEVSNTAFDGERSGMSSELGRDGTGAGRTTTAQGREEAIISASYDGTVRFWNPFDMAETNL